MYEIKIIVVTFQQYRRGKTPYVIISRRTQSNNQASDFNQLVLKGKHAVSLATKKYRLLNVCVDGFSVDSNLLGLSYKLS